VPIIKKDKFSHQREAPPREAENARHLSPAWSFSMVDAATLILRPKQGASQQQTHPLILQQRTRGYKNKMAFSDTNYIF
jgi:hypothetical protein